MQVQVLERDTHVGAEHLDQVQVQLGQSRRAGDDQQVFRILRIGEIQHVVVVAEHVALVFECLVETAQHQRRKAVVDAVGNIGLEIPDRRGHVDRSRHGVIGLGHRAEQRAMLQTDQRRQLREHGRREFVALVARVDCRGRLHHALQAFARGLDHHQVAIAAQGDHHGRFELVRRQLGLFLVVVDVVCADHLTFRRLARMPGAQHDARQAIVELFAHVAHQVQPGVLVFHDDIHDHQRDVLALREDFTALAPRSSLDDVQAAAIEFEMFQHDAGDLTHVRLVVDHEHIPFVGHDHRTCRSFP